MGALCSLGKNWDFIQVLGEREASERGSEGGCEKGKKGSRVPPQGEETWAVGSWGGLGRGPGVNWDMSSDAESVDNSFLPLEKHPALKSSYNTDKRGA